jgi:hypothetical protein
MPCDYKTLALKQICKEKRQDLHILHVFEVTMKYASEI